jgi:ectoine hydroxylase-related dioxygenase (phytanoyl-CoA dioxygenase family)
MTTYPLGYLTAAWIAFEDIDPDCGPLVYYPGSHRLPYVFSKDVGIGEADLKNHGYATYQDRYEPYIRRLVKEHGLEPHYFHAKKGDVLIWHANLIHGGSVRKNLELSRRSAVCHFFVKNAFVYHDLAAAKSRQQYLGTCLLRDDSGKVSLL